MSSQYCEAKDSVEREHREAEEAKWAGVPAWKRALMEGKAAEARAPVERQAMVKEKKMAQLESMPEWKRNLLLQKQQQ